MELLIVILVIYFLITIFSKKTNKNGQSSSTQTQEYNKSISPNKLPQIKKEKIQKKTDKYKPGQQRKKPKISPESYLDPISWNKFEVCEVCGSENRSKVVCCK